MSRAAAAFGDEEVTGSAFLSGAEAGTAALTAGDWASAQLYFSAAARATDSLDSRARLGAENLGEALASMALNDTSLAYRGEGFERVYMHCGLALAYLAQGQLEDVLVEARLANKLLETEEELYDADYRAGGLGHFLSAVAYEQDALPDEAYIDYRRMVDKEVGVELAGKALVRLSEQLGRESDHERWRDRFGEVDTAGAGLASIVVIGGVGLGPYKYETKLTLDTSDGWTNVAVAGYYRREQLVSELRLVLEESGASVRTAMLEDVGRVASENLEDRLAFAALKSLARGLAKRELTQELEEEHGTFGRVVGELFAWGTERADLRFWSTLPDTWQGARLFVEPGRHTLQLQAVGGESVSLGAFELEPGETMYVLARSIHRRVYAHTVGGLSIELGGA